MDVMIYRFVKIHYDKGELVKLHRHDFFHYIYILSGLGEITIDGIKFLVQEGNLFPICVGVEHSITGLGPSGFNAVEIKFITSSSKLFKSLTDLPYKINELPSNIKAVIINLCVEALNKKPYFEDMMNIKLCEMLLLVLQQFNADGQKTPQESFETCDENNQYYAVIKYINENIEKDIQVEELLEICRYSESYFCAKFKKEFGITPRQYINLQKLKRAKMLFLNTNLSVSEVSDKLNFASLHYFSKFFKLYEGISPREYMVKNRNIIQIQFIDGKSRDFIGSEDGFEYVKDFYNFDTE